MTMKLSESFKYGSSVEYTFTADMNESGVSLYEQNNGIGGESIYPAEGDTVTVYADGLDVNLNNKCYYLVSDEIGLSRDQIISQGTEISLSFIGDRLQGTFVYNNPNDYAALYIVFDYTNIVDLTDTVTYGSSSEEYKIINIPLTSAVGNLSVAYTINNPNGRVVLFYNGNLMDDSGVSVSSTSGTLEFYKNSPDINEAKIVFVNTTGLAMTFTATPTFGGLTRFYICDEDGTLENVASQIAINDNVWHNGSETLPVQGDLVFTNPEGSSLYDGGNAYHVVSETLMTVPDPNAKYVSLNDTGEVLSSASAGCGEVLGPVITQPDVTVVRNQRFSIQLEAENNPTNWTLVSLFNTYTLDGGVSGAIFTYDDVDGNAQRVTVSSLESLSVNSDASPVLVAGTGTVTLVGPYQQAGLPAGITFDNGVLSGQTESTGVFSVTVICYNCVGDSLEHTFSLVVESDVKLTPFAIDVNDFMETGALACALTPRYDLLYHNSKVSNIPNLNDVIFVDMKATTPFVGGRLWYNIDDSTYSIQVDEYGTVIDTHVC